jgi:hypothetical protein
LGLRFKRMMASGSVKAAQKAAPAGSAVQPGE